MEQLRGIVERITYANAEKGYSVIKVRVKTYSDLVVLVGNMASVKVGSVVTVSGRWTVNPKHGRQFAVSSWEESVPASIYGVEKYLGSGLIKGIGPKFANLIVRQFGKDTIDIIETQPERLYEVQNIGKKRVEMIKKSWQEQKEIKNIMLFLQEHDVSTAFGYRIFRQYGNESIDVIKENPYRLADDIWGVGFQTADTLATKLGMEKESYVRCRSGIFYVLNQFANEGHCYASFEELTQKGSEILGIEEPKLVITISHLLKEKELFQEEEKHIYLPPFYYAELGVAKRIRDILAVPAPMVSKTVESILDKTQKDNEFVYDSAQIEAIKLVTSSKLSVLTGGPGTGKTTTTKAIIEVFVQDGKSVLLAAPTGRAAKRMSETCGYEAKTIHRLLESKPPNGFGRNKDNPLDGDVLIVDESSMIDIILMNDLLKAVPDSMTVVLIGDIDQLPSVGAGNVLRDIIESGVVVVARLTRVFRQAEHSKIITNAHRINKGQNPDLSRTKNSDFFLIEQDDPNEVVNLIRELCSKRLPKYYHCNGIKDIQVLTPMRRGPIGADSLNKVLQEALNPNHVMLKRGGTEYRLGDKVMQLKNNYDKDVFNGDIGWIVHVDPLKKTLEIDFEGTKVSYDILELDEIVHAYAISIHKSQGGEFPIVVMPFTFSHYTMLNRNLLYTGITRAKRALVILGEKRAIYYAVGKSDSNGRKTSLIKRLQKQ